MTIPARLIAAIVPVSLLGAGALALAPAAHAAPAVSVYPSPGTRYNQPQAQITFRGVPASQIGQVTVIGSKTGVHAGSIAADSDGEGGSFVPSTPFAARETVTVHSGLNIVGGHGGSFSFKIANPANPIAYGALIKVGAARGGVQSFRTAPNLRPPAVRVTRNRAPAAQGDIFVAPQNGPVQNGPMILDSRGNLVWFMPFPVAWNDLVTDFRVQQLFGQPVLTWWQGNTNLGQGRGKGMIYNSRYQPVATVQAGNGLDMDLHEFMVTNNGDAYFTATFPIHVAASRQPMVDSVIQEIDIRTGLVLFEWDALDHVPLSQSYFKPRRGNYIYDPYHANSISLDTDGNLVVSMRNTSTIYKLDRRTGRIIWRLGGKAPSFRMGPGTRTWFQHDAVIHPGEQLTLFDDRGGPPRTSPSSRAIRIKLDTRHRTATLIREYRHAPDIGAEFQGGMQPLSYGDAFIGWGQQPYFSEDNAAGHQIFDAHFAEPTTSYRAYRFVWSGNPPASQLIAQVTPGGKGAVNVYASWNGATAIASWRVLAGSSPSTLAPVATKPKRYFETEITVSSLETFYAVQALDANGRVLGTSQLLHSP